MTAKKVASKAKMHLASKAVKSSAKPETCSDKKAIPSKKGMLSKSSKPLVSRSKKIAPVLKKAVVATKASPKSTAIKQNSSSLKTPKDPKHSNRTVKPAKTAVKKAVPKAVASKTPFLKTAVKPVVKAAAKGPVKASKKVIKTDEKTTTTKPTSIAPNQSTAKTKAKTKTPAPEIKKPSVAVPEVIAPPPKPKATKASAQKSRKKDAKHFTPEELNVFYVTMLDLRERLSAQVTELREQSLLRHDEVNQDEDGTDAFERVTSLDRASNDQAQINQINNAILTITEGTYGLCSDCGEKIERPRLKALPFAKTCIKCQSELEGDTNRRKPSTDLLD